MTDDETSAAAADWPGNCFGCSPRNPHGLHLHFERTSRGCTARHTLAAHHCGLEGIAHGGIVCTLLDEVAAWALILHTAKLGLTTDMHTRFHAPVPTRVPLELEAWVELTDGKRARTRAELRDGAARVLAASEADWALASPAVVSRMSGLDRAAVERFFQARAVR
jgi:acyl-coenzyme A thioesterase PaaI-like protein